MKHLIWLLALCSFSLWADTTGPVTGTLPTNVTSPTSGQCLTYNGTVWVNSACSSSSISPGVPVQGFDTPLNEGATGNGIANDTTPVQTCATTGACYLPPGYTFLVNSTIFVPNLGQFVGAGPTSIIKGSSVSGCVVQAGTHAATNAVIRVNVGGFQIQGTGTTALCTFWAYESKFHDIQIGAGTFTYNGFSFDNSSFSLNLDNLFLDNPTIGSTITFSASVGGAATGTISAGNPGNGSYMVVFSDQEVRRVTVSSTTATWTGNLAAGTITAGNYGAGFFFGSGANGIVGNKLISVNGVSTVPFGFEFEDVNAYGGAQAGDTFNAPVAENCQVCFFFGAVTENIVINSLYCEVCTLPILVGEAAGNFFASGIVINGANISGPQSGSVGYANRYAVIDVQAAYSFVAHNVQFVSGDSTGATAYPLTAAGGTQTTAPKVYASANAAGVIKTCSILYPGDYTTGNPPTSISYTGGNAGSGATFTITTGTTPFGQLGLTGCAVSAGGTGYTASMGMVPVTFNGPNGANRGIVIDSFDWGWGLSGSLNISSIMAYDSVNTSGYSRSGYTIYDTGYYDAENGSNLFGSVFNHAPENNNREFGSSICASGVPCSYIVPIVSFP